MVVGHVQRQRFAAEKWVNFAVAMFGAGSFALVAVVVLVTMDMRALVRSHQADKQKIELLTMISNAAELGQSARTEELATQHRERSEAALGEQRHRTDEAIDRVRNDSSIPTPLSDSLRELAADAREFVTDLRVMAADQADDARNRLVAKFVALRTTARTALQAMVRQDVENDILAAKWLIVLGLLAVVAVLVLIGLVWYELGLRRRAMAGVAQAREAVGRAERTRSRFLQAVGHDLRQPLQAIMLFATGLERRVRDEEALSLLDNLRSALDSMRRMLSGLTDVSRLDAGVVSADPVVIPVDEILRPIAAEFGSLAADKGILFRSVPSELQVRTDPVMVECILRNLVSNAVRFTRSGEVVVRCRAEGDSCMIDVTDSGPGIADEEKTRIFQEFYRVASGARSAEARSADARQADGLGLGLAIVKRMVNLLGAKIELRSTVGVGTTFTVTLQLSPPAGPRPGMPRLAMSDSAMSDSAISDSAMAWPAAVAEPVDPVALLAGVRVLLVDDDESIARALVPELTSRGMSVVALRHPDSVCQLFAKGDVPAFDIALVDRDLNADMTGPELLDHLAVRFHVALPALLISGTTDFEVIRELQSSDYPWLAKPVPLPTLLREMGRIVEEETGHVAEGATGVRTPA